MDAMLKRISLGLVCLTIISVTKGYTIASCTTGWLEGVNCSCPTGEILASPYSDLYNCYPRDERCPNGYMIEFLNSRMCKCLWGDEEGGKCKQPCGKCENGWCSSKSTCVCNLGFKMSEGNTLCEPICEPGCLNGFCKSPGKCACNKGYAMSNKTGKCELLNAMCLESGKCYCNEGYFMSKSLQICEPVCEEGCHNGICEGPGKCSCKTGYQMSNVTKNCEPVCDSKCPNGSCHSPGKCVCNIGYVKHSELGNCEPSCKKCCEKEYLSDNCLGIDIL